MQFVSATKLAELLDVPQPTFSRWILQGRVPGAVKVSNMWLVPDNLRLEDIDVPKMGRPVKQDDKRGENGIHD